MRRLVTAACFLAGLLFLCVFPQSAVAQNTVASVTVGTNPISVAVNPVTNKIYVANQSSASVTVIDGATNSTTNVNVGTSPYCVAVNPVTNMIYVANRDSTNVTVIDGATNNTTTVSAGTNPRSLAVNPVTNKIYVANQGSNNVTVIDGATNSTTTVTAGTAPYAAAVDPASNKIYVGNDGSNNVTVIDGATNSTVNVNVGSSPDSIAVNPVTNQVYAANIGSASVTVIDGATNNTTTVGVGNSPSSIVVNPVTNTIYVANLNSVTVINGATNSTATVSGGIAPISPVSLAVNTLNNKIYVANSASANVTVIDGATNSTSTLSAGTNPISTAVNPVTNKIYVANYGSANVTLIDGATNSTVTVATGGGSSVAVNPVTNKIYVSGGSGVTVIDGTTYAIANVATGNGPLSVAVNPVTNKIYVANQGGNNVTVIDGATNFAANVATGSGPICLAVNPVTNRIYVANQGSNTVSVIDGATNATSTVAAGASPSSVAVNSVTNKIYVVNAGSDNVTVIDGATSSTITVNMNGYQPNSIAVNTVTNQIYVGATNGSSNSGGGWSRIITRVTVIDGLTNATTNVSISDIFLQTYTVYFGLSTVAVNPLTNKIYVASTYDSNLTVIEGTTNSTSTVGGGASSFAVNPVTNKVYTGYGVVDGATNSVSSLGTGGGPIAVNPVTNKIYSVSGNGVTVITEQSVVPVPLSTSITPLPNNLTNSPTPSFIFNGQTTFSPNAPAVQNVFYQVDTWQGPWLSSAPSFSGATPALQGGVHILYAYAADSQLATSTQAGSPLIGNITAYLFLVDPPTSIAASEGTPQSAGVNATFATALRATVTLASGLPVSGATITFTAPSSGASGTFAPNASTIATATTNASGVVTAPVFTANSTIGSYAVTATVVGISTPASFSLTNSPTTPAISALSASSAIAGSPGFVLTVTGSGFLSGAAVLWNGSSRVTTVISSTSLNASITASDIASAGNDQVTVANPAPFVGPSNALPFTVLNPVPTLFTLSPSSATSGSSSFSLTVSGANFVNGAAVWWNGSPRSTTFTSSTSLSASITTADVATGGTFPVTVVNPAPDAGVSAALNFTVNNLVPALSSLSTTSAPAGTAGVVVTITGSGFVNGATVQVNGTARTTVFNSSTSLGGALTTTDLAVPKTLSITVRNPDPTTIASNSLTFTVTGNNAVPAIAALSPATVGAGSVSFTLTVYGTNFAPVSQVLWNNSARTTSFGSSQQIGATITAADVATAGAASVTVFTPAPGGGTSSAMTFTVGSLPQGSLAAQAVNGSPGAPVSIPVVLTLDSGATVGALSFGVLVAPTGNAPPIAANMAFLSDAALPVPGNSPPTVTATNTNVGAFFGSFTASLTGQVAIGVVQVAIPASAAVGQTYNVHITAADAAQGSAAVPLTAGADATLTLVVGYLVGDSYPHTADSVGSFGDGLLNTLDLIDALRAVTNISTPAICSDRFDDLDSYPVDTVTARGGDGFVNTLDLIETLRRVTDIDMSRPARTPRGLTCSQMEPDSRRARPIEPAEGTIEVHGNAIYLLAHRDLNLAGLALSLILQDGQQGNFTPGDIPASIVDVGQPGKIAMAWLNGVKLASSQRVLLAPLTARIAARCWESPPTTPTAARCALREAR